MYYYFKKRNNKIVEIVSFDHQINLLLNRWYEPLTQEQVDFYLQNPSASVQEVIDCQLTPPYVPPTPDVTEYANQKVTELKSECLAHITISDIEYAMANAVLAGTSLVYSGAKHYTTAQAKTVMERFMDESHVCMSIYDTYKPQLLAASTINTVDTLYETAITQLNAL